MQQLTRLLIVFAYLFDLNEQQIRRFHHLLWNKVHIIEKGGAI